MQPEQDVATSGLESKSTAVDLSENTDAANSVSESDITVDSGSRAENQSGSTGNQIDQADAGKQEVSYWR